MLIGFELPWRPAESCDGLLCCLRVGAWTLGVVVAGTVCAFLPFNWSCVGVPYIR